MEEKLLLKVSLIISVTGLGAMIFISYTININKTSIESITPNDVGRSVKACGQVEDKFTSKNLHTFFTLSEGSETIKVVVFNSTKIPPFAWEEVCITGRVELYEGELEIIAEEVIDV